MWLAFFSKPSLHTWCITIHHDTYESAKTYKGCVSFKCYKYVGGVMAMIDEVLTYCCFLFLKKPMDTQHGTKICRERDSRPKNILQCA